MDGAGHLVREHLRAFAAGDLPALLATLADDAVFVSGTTTVPPAEFAEFFGWAMRELHPDMAITRIVAEGEQVACEFVETVTPDGERQQLHRAAFYTVSGGVITHAKVYDERE